MKLASLRIYENHRLVSCFNSRGYASSAFLCQKANIAQNTDAQNLKKKTRPSTPISDELRKKLNIPFKRGEYGHFTQVAPCQENLYSNNPFLTAFVKRIFPKEIYREIENDLTRFGRSAVTDIYPIGRQCEINPPYVQKYDAWGNRIDKLVTCESWKAMKDISAKEGLIATAYENKYREYDRVYQMLKLYLFAPVSGLYSCPLAMTDGAAKTAMVTKSPILEKAFRHLTSRDPKQFWTSGQWMTEKRGGSDVSGATETFAVEQPDGYHQLYGYKWFSSATDSDMSLTLANIVSEESPVKKKKGLTMFYLETRNELGQLNGIEIINLKNKLGTRQLPTAELLLDGTVANQVSEEGRGVANIAEMLTITRVHNSLSAASNMRRIILLARDYAKRRKAFGKSIADHSLHQLTSARMEVVTRGCEAFVFQLVRLLGKEESGVATEIDSLVLRIMTPIMKMFTAKCAMSVVSEGLECFGGQGYIEDTGLPVLLRDSQVLPIWEGTTNIMSLDVLRSIIKSEGRALSALFQDIAGRLQLIKMADNSKLVEALCKIESAVKEISNYIMKHPDLMDRAARDVSTSLAHVYTGSLLAEIAALDKSEAAVDVVTHWCLMPLNHINHDAYLIENTKIVYEGYNEDNIYGSMF